MLGWANGSDRSTSSAPTMSSEQSPQQSSQQSPEQAPDQHDSFLELLRNVSVLRVVLLHLVLRPPLIYLPWIQWIYPGMPEIFFVSGALAAASIGRRGAAQVTIRRMRRVLLPYGVYAVVALLSMAVTDRRSADPAASLSWRSVLTFVFPLTEPTGSTTRAILWSHLWFVTVFLWLVLLTPWLLRATKHLGVGVVALPLVMVAGAVFGRQAMQWNVPSEIGLIGQFGTYYAMGVLWAQRGPRASTSAKTAPSQETSKRHARWWLVGAMVFGAAGVIVGTIIEPIRNKRPPELYSSRTAYLLIGLAWLALALAFHEPLSSWTRRHQSRWLQACTQRTFTLYLWGLPADSIGVAVSKHLLPNRWLAVPVYVVVSLAALTAAVIAVGWVEDMSAGRRPRIVPWVRGEQTRQPATSH